MTFNYESYCDKKYLGKCVYTLIGQETKQEIIT
jgi:hypothetical protein